MGESQPSPEQPAQDHDGPGFANLYTQQWIANQINDLNVALMIASKAHNTDLAGSIRMQIGQLQSSAAMVAALLYPVQLIDGSTTDPRW